MKQHYVFSFLAQIHDFVQGRQPIPKSGAGAGGGARTPN
jgi:hypothetical protein